MIQVIFIAQPEIKIILPDVQFTGPESFGSCFAIQIKNFPSGCIANISNMLKIKIIDLFCRDYAGNPDSSVVDVCMRTLY